MLVNRSSRIPDTLCQHLRSSAKPVFYLIVIVFNATLAGARMRDNLPIPAHVFNPLEPQNQTYDGESDSSEPQLSMDSSEDDLRSESRVATHAASSQLDSFRIGWNASDTALKTSTHDFSTSTIVYESSVMPPSATRVVSTSAESSPTRAIERTGSSNAEGQKPPMWLKGKSTITGKKQSISVNEVILRNKC